MPFARAAAECAWFTGVPISATSVRRLPEAAVAEADAVLAEPERTSPAAPAGPALQQVSADGAMVPLLGDDWAEVKTVTAGTVTATAPAPDGSRSVQTEALSSFSSRLTDADTFTRLATVELHRRGTATAGRIVAVMDGSVWLQGFTDYHRPDAVRVLDFPHAAERVAAPVRAIWGEGSDTGRQWLDHWLHELTRGDPADVLEALCLLPAATLPAPAAETLRAAAVEYLVSRWEQIQYATFLAAGLPMGSGCIESGNKLVMEARLKGSGMHWAGVHVNAMLALRTLACNDRWAEGWPQIAARRRRPQQAVRRPRVSTRATTAPATTPAPTLDHDRQWPPDGRPSLEAPRPRRWTRPQSPSRKILTRTQE